MINDDSLAKIWQFSASSQAHLQRCLKAVKSSNNKNNKWFQKFIAVVNNDSMVTEKKTDFKDIETSTSVETKNDQINNEDVTVTNLEHEEFCREVIDADPITNFDYMVERCLKDSSLYQVLANTISSSSVVKICNHVFNSKDVNILFTEHLYTIFLPAFLKKEHSMLSLDLLVKASESNPMQFKLLLGIVLNDNDIPTNILQQFVTTQTAKDKTKFLINIMNIDISNEVFINNLFTMYVAYKDCIKTGEINSYMLLKLIKVAQNCSNDKNYGRFLLNYIQSQTCTANIRAIEQLLESHRSPFKKPCQNALNNLKKE